MSAWDASLLHGQSEIPYSSRTRAGWLLNSVAPFDGGRFRNYGHNSHVNQKFDTLDQPGGINHTRKLYSLYLPSPSCPRLSARRRTYLLYEGRRTTSESSPREATRFTCLILFASEVMFPWRDLCGIMSRINASTPDQGCDEPSRNWRQILLYATKENDGTRYCVSSLNLVLFLKKYCEQCLRNIWISKAKMAPEQYNNKHLFHWILCIQCMWNKILTIILRFRVISPINYVFLVIFNFILKIDYLLIWALTNQIDRTSNGVSCPKVWNTDQAKNHWFFSALYV